MAFFVAPGVELNVPGAADEPRPSWAATVEGNAWSRLEFGKWKFGPPHVIVHVSNVGCKLRQDHKVSRGKDRGPRDFTGLDTHTISCELHVITAEGERLVREALSSDLMPQANPAARAFLPVKYPSIQASRQPYLACVEYEEEVKDGIWLVKLKFESSETGGTKLKGSATVKPQDAAAEVPVVEIDARPAGPDRNLTDFRYAPRPTVSPK